MKSISAKIIVIAISFLLTACAHSQAAENVQASDIPSTQSQTVAQQIVAIDWESAKADANRNIATSRQAQPNIDSPTSLAVPLLLPPNVIALSDTSPKLQTLSPAKLVADKRGYSAVIETTVFTILIDAANQTFITQQANNTTPQMNFDGDYQVINNGGQISIGRYGALYAVQLLCLQENKPNCITERMVREVIDSLLVVTPE